MKKSLLTLFLFQFFAAVINCQEWIVPAERASRLSTFQFTDETRKAGETIYRINCISCHGNPGQGNFINLEPPPGDPAKDKIQRNMDGEIFYKVSTGRGQMPSFRSVLSANDIWNVISYIRSFNRSYEQEIIQVIKSAAYPGAEIRVVLSCNPGDTMIILTAQAVKDNMVVPVTNAAVQLYVSRRFGLLRLDEEQITGSDGIARFRIPDGLPGDTSGNINVIARFSDEGLFGSASEDTILGIAEKTIPISLVAERAMWNKAMKAPVWVILTFCIGLVLVWVFIFLVLLKLRDIFIIGKSIKPDNRNS